MTDFTDDTTFWLTLGDGAGRCLAAGLRLLRYGAADAQAWQSLRGGLLLMAKAIGERFTPAKVAEHATTTIAVANGTVDIVGTERYS